MRPHLFTFLTIALTLISCKEKKQKNYDNSIIDPDKIDEVFGNDTSSVLLDHLYIVLDSISYAKLAQDNALNGTYAMMDIGLPDFKPFDDKATSCYLRGHRHFIELLGPNNQYGEPVGKSGIGFSLHNKGEHFHLGLTPKLKQKKTPYLSMSEKVDMPIGEDKMIALGQEEQQIRPEVQIILMIVMKNFC